jgi:hypothetical protein
MESVLLAFALDLAQGQLWKVGGWRLGVGEHRRAMNQISRISHREARVVNHLQFIDQNSDRVEFIILPLSIHDFRVAIGGGSSEGSAGRCLIWVAEVVEQSS